MSKLIIIRGNSGSGKSSVATALQRRLGRNNLMIPQDLVRRVMLFARDGKQTVAQPLLINLLDYGMEHCEYVILEGILNSKWYKPLFEHAMSIFGTEIYAYYYDLPFEETVKRHKTKINTDFGEDELRDWWNEKDYIGYISEKAFTEAISLEEAVNIICRDLTVQW